MMILCLISCSGPPLPDMGVTILSPKAGDSLQGGSPYEVTWKTDIPESEFGAYVTVQFSKDGGKNWETVAENVPRGGKHTWNVPKVDSKECKIRVSSQYRPRYKGTSEGFSIK